MRRHLFLILFFIGIYSHAQKVKTMEIVPPLDIPLLLSGNFGENRISHWHTGLDIKTLGREGVEVKSIAKGYVSRIKISTKRYGKSIYITHPNNTTSVYAHLQKFSKKIETYIKGAQYASEIFEIEKHPYKNSLPIAKGEIIGYSGNTGISKGAHLHFELRNDLKKTCINPLFFMDVKDDVKPTIQHGYLWAKDENSGVNYAEKPIYKLNLIKKNDSTYTATTVKAIGTFGLAMTVFDRQSDSNNKNEVYHTKLYVNGVLVFQNKLDELFHKDSKFALNQIYFEDFIENKRISQKLFSTKKYPISTIQKEINNGLFNIEHNKSYKIKAVLTDYHNNNTTFIFYIEGDKNILLPPVVKQDGKKITPSMDYIFPIAQNMYLYVPKKAVFESVYIAHKKIKDTIHIKTNTPFPIRKSFELEMPYTPKTYLAYLKESNKESNSIRPIYRRNKQIFKINRLGEYLITKDTIPPKITPLNFHSQRKINSIRFLKLKIEDDLSGVKQYRGTINGEWVLFEYEPKEKMLFYHLEDKKWEGERHNLEIYVKDNVGNETTFQTYFIKKYLN